MDGKKPWEEEWMANLAFGTVTCCGSPRLRAELGRDDGVAEQDACLIMATAAPLMVRALIGLGRSGWRGADREWHLGVCWNGLQERGATCLSGCAEARAALQAAGVPLP